MILEKTGLFDHFYDLVVPKMETKKVKCIKCRVEFMGNKAKRFCSACKNHRDYDRTSYHARRERRR